MANSSIRKNKSKRRACARLFVLPCFGPLFSGAMPKPAAGHKAEKTCVPGKSRALGFVRRAKKPRNIYRANGALRLLLLPAFRRSYGKTQQAARAFVKTNSSAFGYAQQPLSRPGVLQWSSAGYRRKFGTAARGLSKFTDGIKTQNLVGKRRAPCAPFSSAHFWGSA